MSEQLIMDAVWNERGFDEAKCRKSYFPWTNEHIETLKRMWSNNRSFGQIAAELGCSRNAAIGKAHRLGLKGPPRPERQHKALRPKSPKGIFKRTPRKPPMLFDNYQSPTVDVVPLNLTLIELKSGQCRYPYGDSNYLFCGNPVIGQESYCLGHFRITHKGYEQEIAEQARKAA